VAPFELPGGVDSAADESAVFDMITSRVVQSVEGDGGVPVGFEGHELVGDGTKTVLAVVQGTDLVGSDGASVALVGAVSSPFLSPCFR